MYKISNFSSSASFDNSVFECHGLFDCLAPDPWHIEKKISEPSHLRGDELTQAKPHFVGLRLRHFDVLAEFGADRPSDRKWEPLG